jgi:hypothetical protein
MGTTPNYGLRKPTDPNAPADLITIVGQLADDVDAAMRRELDARPGLGGAGAAGTWPISITGSAGYAAGAGNADTVDGMHFQGHDRGESLPYLWGSGDGGGDNRLMHASRLGGTHSHNPSQSGITVLHHGFGSLAAGQTKSQVFGRANDQYPTVSVQHPSTYIYAVISSLDNGTYTVEVRNGTSSTNHANVSVIIHLVRAA